MEDSNIILEFVSRCFVTGLQIKTDMYLGKREAHFSRSTFLRIATCLNTNYKNTSFLGKGQKASRNCGSWAKWRGVGRLHDQNCLTGKLCICLVSWYLELREKVVHLLAELRVSQSLRACWRREVGEVWSSLVSGELWWALVRVSVV